jgi:hypothetical protein
LTDDDRPRYPGPTSLDRRRPTALPRHEPSPAADAS